MPKLAAIGFRHGHAWSTMKELLAQPDMKLVGLYEDHPPLLQRALDQWPAKTYSDPIELLDREKPDIVALCPTNTRKGPLIVECFRRGVSVFVDKPLFVEIGPLEEAERLRLSAKKRPALMASMGLRSIPLYVTALRLVREGKIGKVASVYTRRPHKLGPKGRNPWELDVRDNGGVLIDLGIHDLDFVMHALRSRPEFVIGCQGNLRFTELPHFIDSGSMHFHFENGAVATIEPNWLNPDASAFHGDCCMLFMGTEGFLTLDETLGTVRLTTLNEKERQIELVKDTTDLVVDFLRQHSGERYEIEPSEIVEANRWVIRATQSALQGGRAIKA